MIQTMKDWKAQVCTLHAIDNEIELMPKGKEKFRLQRLIKEMWLMIWDYYPEKNESVSNAYYKNFK